MGMGYLTSCPQRFRDRQLDGKGQRILENAEGTLTRSWYARLMSSKSLIYFFLVVGSIGGGWLPTLWGAGAISLQSLLRQHGGWCFGNLGGL